MRLQLPEKSPHYFWKSLGHITRGITKKSSQGWCDGLQLPPFLAELLIPAGLWETPLHLSWWCPVLVLKHAMIPPWLWESSAVLMWQHVSPARLHPILESQCAGSMLAASSYSVLQVDTELSDYSAHNFLSLGLEGSVCGDCSIRQIRVKDNILSSILLLSLPASFVCS